jgi:hypothetical protein
VCIDIHTLEYTDMLIFMRRTYTNIIVHVHKIYMYTHVNKYMYLQLWNTMYEHTHTHIYTPTYIHTSLYTHTYTHVHIVY